MKKKYSITLLVAMFSLLIIGFGGAVTAAAAGECAETQLANGASDSTAVTNCRAYEADAARYAAIQAFYTSEANNVERAFKADAARYTAMAAFYNSEAINVQRTLKADAARYTDLAAFYTSKAINVQRAFKADSTYQAANPELMTSHRFVVADGSATVASAPGAIESQSSLNLYPNYAPGHLGH